MITCDAGREFLGEFIKKAAAEGIVVHQIATKAPWQQGKTERHGGHFKQLLDKARSEVVVQDLRDLRRLMTEVEQAKNRYSNRSGFAPVQRQIGQWPRLPTSILSDEAVDPTLYWMGCTDDIEKLHHMRRIAHKPFVNTMPVLPSSVPRKPDQEHGPFKVYRVPRLKKRKHGGIVDDSAASTKARWVGPGVVITLDGANLWVSMMGELWKVAREQCRHATTDEKTGIEAVLQECQELIEEFKRGSHRTGYKDITEEELPPDKEEDHGEPAQGRRSASLQPRFYEPDDMQEYSPEWPDLEPEAPEEGEEELALKRRKSINEPEQEEVPSSRASSERGRPSDMYNPAFPGGVPETPTRTPAVGAMAPTSGLDPQVQEAMRISEARASRLDGTPNPPPNRPG